MKVSEALAARRSVRAFLDKPVDIDIVRGALEKAALAPSGGNLQPWHAVVLSGAPLGSLKSAMHEALKQPLGSQTPEYEIYPSDLPDPYRARRWANAEAMYASIGLTRENKPGRMAQLAKNFDFFGALMGLFLHTPRLMGPPQWSDLGMWLQSLMLLLVEAGLASCPQESWALYPKTVRCHVPIPDEHILFCGLAIGYADTTAPLNVFPNSRAPLSETVTFIG